MDPFLLLVVFLAIFIPYRIYRGSFVDSRGLQDTVNPRLNSLDNDIAVLRRENQRQKQLNIELYGRVEALEKRLTEQEASQENASG